MKSQKTVTIKVAVKGQITDREIPCIAVYGCFAVHRDVNDRLTVVVSHIPSGSRAAIFDHMTPSHDPKRRAALIGERERRAKSLAAAMSKIPDIENFSFEHKRTGKWWDTRTDSTQLLKKMAELIAADRLGTLDAKLVAEIKGISIDEYHKILRLTGVKLYA